MVAMHTKPPTDQPDPADLVRLSADGIVVVDPDGVVRFANPAAEALLGRGSGGAIGLELGYPAAGDEATIINLPGTGDQRAIVEMRAAETTWDDRPAFVVNLRDVTLEVRSEQNLRQSLERIDSLYDAVGEGIFSVRMPARVIDRVNPRVDQIFGYAPGELIGQSTAVLYPSEKAYQGYGHQLGLALERGQRRIETEQRLKRKSGEDFPCEVTTTFLFDGDRLTDAISVVRDISVRKQAEEQIHRLNQALEGRVAQRTAALQKANHYLEAFSSSVSHDLKAPLRRVLGFCQALREDRAEQLGPDGLDLLERALAEAEQMTALVDALLDLSRLTTRPLEPAEVDLSAAARAVAADLAAGGDVSVRIVVNDTPPARGDARLLRQVLWNLLGNAVKFSQQNTAPQVVFDHQTEADRIVYRVRDNGVGFDPRQAADLFTPFKRLHDASQFPGTGVGLSTVERIIHRHGGQIWFDSAPGQGATFFFTIGQRRLDAPGAALHATQTEE